MAARGYTSYLHKGLGGRSLCAFVKVAVEVEVVVLVSTEMRLFIPIQLTRLGC